MVFSQYGAPPPAAPEACIVDKEIEEALHQDLGEFDRELSRVGCVWGQEPNFADFERKVVKSIPPVELHVGRVATDSPKLVLLIYSARFGTF